MWDRTLVDYVSRFGLRGLGPHGGSFHPLCNCFSLTRVEGMSLPESIGFVGLGAMGAPVIT